MANVFADLPLPVLNGPGAAVDTSMMAIPKTIEVVGSFPGSTIAIEISEDGGATFATATMFQDVGGKRVLDVVAQFMRVNVLGRKTVAAFAADAGVGAPEGVPQFAAIAMPAGNGVGPPTDISTFGAVITVVMGGLFPDAVILFEVSEDGTEPYAPLFSFAGQGGQKSAVVTAGFIRARVSGRRPALPFAATAAIGGVAGPGPAGPVGPIGPAGPIGPIGPIGPPGTSAVLIWGCQSIPASGMPRYLAPGRIDSSPSLVNLYGFVAPRAGTLRNLFARHNSAGNGGTVTYVVVVNGVGTLLSVPLSAAAIGQAANLVNAVAIAQGDWIALYETVAGGPGGNVDAQITCEFAG